MKYAKVKQGKAPPVFLALMMLGFWLVTCSAQAIAGEYAVQIAAVRSLQCAEDMRGGLHVRGLDAYWVRIVLPQHGEFYRVRLGKFPSIETAYSYAESLLDTGLLESYAITTYELPNSVPLRDSTQASLEVQEYIQQPAAPRDTRDLLAAIGARQWWLPNTSRLFTTTPQLPPINIGLTQREALVYALSRKDWRLSYDLSVLFVRAPAIASNTDVVASANDPAPAVNANQLVTLPGALPTIINAAPVTAPKPIERSFALANAPLTPPPPPSFAPAPAKPTTNIVGNPVAPLTSNKAFSDSRTATPDIGRGNKPAPPVRYGRIAPVRLQASAEMRNGQLVMKIRNLDLDRSFTGTARVTLSDDRKSNDLAPMKFDVNADGEIEVPINENVAAGGDWMLMVYDEAGALRLIRGQMIGSKNASGQQAQNNRQPGQADLTAPPYVTPVFDATGSSIPSVGSVPTSQNSVGNNSSSGAAGSSGSGSTPTDPVDPTAPAQLTVTPRLIATTTENVTMEFDIASPQPLQYISVTLAAGEYRDTRQALMSTTRGRVPFLIPAVHAQGAFLFEVKDESGRTLAGGAGDFRQMTGR
ncbi:MAG: SPOR domain-containing protein [Blastocatellia bacterium]